MRSVEGEELTADQIPRLEAKGFVGFCLGFKTWALEAVYSMSCLEEAGEHSASSSQNMQPYVLFAGVQRHVLKRPTQTECSLGG